MSQFNEELLLLLQQHGGKPHPVAEDLIADLLKAGGRGVAKEKTISVLVGGLSQILSRHRQDVRKRIRDEDLAPVSTMGQAQNAPRYKRAEKAIRERTVDMLAEWMVGDMQLGDMSKAALLKEVEQETASSEGHRFNAEFYAKLAAPLNDKQVVKDHWKSRGVQILKDTILEKLLATTDRAKPLKTPAEERATV